VETVWEVLRDFGDIQRWSPGVTYSELTSQGPVSEGSTRHCDFAPFGGVNERVDQYLPNERLTVNLYETFKLPISGAIADFNIAPHDDGTQLTLHYRYTPNRLGRLMKGYTEKQMRKGIGGMAKGLQRERAPRDERVVGTHADARRARQTRCGRLGIAAGLHPGSVRHGGEIRGGGASSLYIAAPWTSLYLPQTRFSIWRHRRPRFRAIRAAT